MRSGARATLKENIGKLIDAYCTGARRSVRAWAVAKKVDVKVAQRAENGETAATIATLDYLAERLSLEPWQLLYPQLDPAKPPQPERFSLLALDLARMLDRIRDDEEKKRLHAVITQMIEFANVEPEPEEPSPEPRRKPAKTAPR